MGLRSLEQERAKFAYDCVSEVRRSGEETQKRYVSYVKSAPALILTNGLGQALAFYLSKMGNGGELEHSAINPEVFEEGEKRAYAFLYSHITGWLAEKMTGGKDPLKVYMEGDSMTAIAITEEALALLNWLKRFGDAMLKKDKNGEG
ncbi:type III-B CRISPR module-associated protein Cmr5 [Thermococcus sp. JdF3]|uniref:type III-B CRISPR module-associated protein Cmr5 n=1 Tax=Thermococcus sp. JdF3 TaxID=1638258 RepID=UPI00143C7F8A|nr:type III-B CRISPR module-associated protein Cmr5 [Thermococcus sp. JdF3]NJE01390.1 type III-B CRISPR module-associated protein Cmr5 [Thermococcus sp. JdF3]